MTSEQPEKTTITQIIDSIINDKASTAEPSQQNVVIQEVEVGNPNRREHARLYQREYRKKQKAEKEMLKETQIKGVELIMVASDGQIVSRDLSSEEEYIDMITDLLESMKKLGHILSYRIGGFK